MSFSYEKDFEDALVLKLTEIDNQWSKNVLEYKDEKALIQNWADVLFQNNNTKDRLNGCPLTETEMQSLINYVNGLKTPYAINQLLNGKYIPLTRDNPDDKLHYHKNIYLFIFDKEDIAAGRSVYQIARQPIFHLPSDVLGNRKGDLTLLINGLPLIHIELKRTGVPVSQAVNQIEKYMKHGVFTGLFSFVQVFLAMNPEETIYFANPGREKPFNPNYYFHWGDFDNKHINDWLDIAGTLLSIPMAHRLIGYGTISDAKDKTLKVMRSYQYHAAYRIYTRVLGRQDWNIPDQKGGYVYHTTGSGKTLTSFKCAQLIAASNKVDKIIFLMDRSELWKQTFDNYIGFSDGEDIQDTDNVDILKSILKSEPKSQLIVTSIQKMSRLTKDSLLISNSDIEKIEKKKLVFIIDEAHRDVAGTMLADIKITYPNAMFFGFTGTPIKDVNATNGITTEGLFGECLHTYNILEGIRDFNVLGFKPFKVMTFDESELRDFVAKEKAKIDNLATATNKQFGIYQEWMNKKMVDIENELTSSLYSEDIIEPKTGEKHRQKVVDNILSNWDTLSYRNKFHHILATSSIREAVAYYKLLKNNDKGLTVTAIFDPHTDNMTGDVWKDEAIEEILNDYNSLFSTTYNVANYKGFKSDVCAKLAHTEPYENLDEERDNAVNIIIVVNQLLTGFDSRWINVLYLDKVLIYEQYIQACSRTNRLFGHEKPYGIIKYYRKPYTMNENAEEALRLYVEHGYEKVFVSSFGTNLSNINKFFNDINALYTRNGIHGFSKLPSSEADKKLFADLFNNMNLYIERAIPELFTWSQKKYDTEDMGEIKIKIDEYTYDVLRQRYSELSNSRTPGDPIIYDIKPYLAEISSDEINKAFLESKYTEFIKDLTNGGTKEQIEKILAELRGQFAILSVDDQHTADRILEDILAGELKDFNPSKSFKDYIDLYNHNILLENIDKLCAGFGFSKFLLIKIMSYHLKEENLNRYARFDQIMDTINHAIAKATLERIEGVPVPDFKVHQKASKILKKFILLGGFSI